MDDCIVKMTAAVTTFRRRKQIIEDTNQLALVSGLFIVKDAIVSQEHIYSRCDVPCTRYSSYVLGTDFILLEAAYTVVLFEWHVAAFELY